MKCFGPWFHEWSKWELVPDMVGVMYQWRRCSLCGRREIEYLGYTR